MSSLQKNNKSAPRALGRKRINNRQIKKEHGQTKDYTIKVAAYDRQKKKTGERGDIVRAQAVNAVGRRRKTSACTLGGKKAPAISRTSREAREQNGTGKQEAAQKRESTDRKANGQQSGGFLNAQFWIFVCTETKLPTIAESAREGVIALMFIFTARNVFLFPLEQDRVTRSLCDSYSTI